MRHFVRNKGTQKCPVRLSAFPLDKGEEKAHGKRRKPFQINALWPSCPTQFLSRGRQTRTHFRVAPEPVDEKHFLTANLTMISLHFPPELQSGMPFCVVQASQSGSRPRAPMQQQVQEPADVRPEIPRSPCPQSTPEQAILRVLSTPDSRSASNIRFRPLPPSQGPCPRPSFRRRTPLRPSDDWTRCAPTRAWRPRRQPTHASALLRFDQRSVRPSPSGALPTLQILQGSASDLHCLNAQKHPSPTGPRASSHPGLQSPRKSDQSFRSSQSSLPEDRSLGPENAGSRLANTR